MSSHVFKCMICLECLAALCCAAPCHDVTCHAVLYCVMQSCVMLYCAWFASHWGPLQSQHAKKAHPCYPQGCCVYSRNLLYTGLLTKTSQSSSMFCSTMIQEQQLAFVHASKFGAGHGGDANISGSAVPPAIACVDDITACWEAQQFHLQ